MVNYDRYIKSSGTHYISNSGHDENGKYHGGKAGDQTGQEWQLRSWYNRPWSCVLRWSDQTAAQKFAELGIDAALNNKIGYDQYQRKTYWTQLEKVGYDPAKIQTACEADCTAGVTCNCKAVGYLLNIAKLKSLAIDTYSGNMRTRFKNAGFTVLTNSKYLTSADYLLPGDVLLYEGHHAAMNITLGKKAGAWNSVNPKQDDGTPKVYVTGSAVNVRTAPNILGKVMGTVHKGDALVYQDNDSESGWHLVVYNGQNGWISPKYTDIRRTKIMITGRAVNIRSEASAAGKIYGTAHMGDMFAYLGDTKDGWYHIQYGDRSAWVSSKYSEVINK